MSSVTKSDGTSPLAVIIRKLVHLTSRKFSLHRLLTLSSYGATRWTMSAKESSNGADSRLLTDAAVAASNGGAYIVGVQQPRRLTASHYETLYLWNSDGASYLFRRPFKDVASALFEKDDSSSSSYVDSYGGVEQEKRWREFSMQIKEIYRQIGRIEHPLLRMMAFWCKTCGPTLALFVFPHPSKVIAVLIVLVTYTLPIVIFVFKDRLVLAHLESIQAICKKETKESLGSLGSNGLVVHCEALSGSGFGEYTDPAVYLLRTDKQVQQFDVSNSRAAKWYNCQQTPFAELAAGIDAPCAEIRTEWAEFWSKMTILCTHRTLYHYLPPIVRDSGVAIVIIIFTALIEIPCFGLFFFLVNVVCYVYDAYVYTRQKMAKKLLVWKYGRKFEPYNVRMELREINHFHEWLGISVRQYVYVFFPIQPETGLGETQPAIETASVTFDRRLERALDDLGETLFVAVQSKHWWTKLSID
jgi:hypothetical protein